MGVSDPYVIGRVEWVDSSHQSGWHREGDISYEPTHCVTVGFVVASDDEAITLVQSLTRDGQHDAAMTIPLCCVVRKELYNLHG